MLDIWAVESMKDDLVAEVLAEYKAKPAIELVSHVIVDWTRPQLMAVAGTMTFAAAVFTLTYYELRGTSEGAVA